MPTTTVKATSTKTPAVKKSTTASKGHHAAHPSWIDMIKECIVAHPEDARSGVSRPTIKKFVESKHHVEINASAASQLNRAIAHGAEKGVFVLPKGPSGKVKLAGRGHSDAAKENTKPPVKKSVTVKAKSTLIKKTTSTKKPAPGKKPLKAKAPATTGTITKAKSTKPNPGTTKKYTSAKKGGAVKARPVAVKKSAVPKKAISAKKASVKKTVTGESKPKKAAAKPKPKVTTLKTTKAPASKGKPVSKTNAKPASKAKPSSRKA